MYLPITRRLFLATATLAAWGLAVPGCSAPPPSTVQRPTPAALTDASGRHVVRTQQGLLRGVVQDGVLVLRGVPFAAPPVGPLRFRAPQPAANWEGIRDATHNASSCVQPTSPLTNLGGTERSEDCLYLNVWAPREAGNHPVFVWVHGGSNTVGSPSEPIYDGTEFARRGVVVVDVAYRVGILGFLELGKILGPDYRGSSSNGLKDIVSALGWVRDNIPLVGGNPSRITVGGESAGGKTVTALLGAPSARGLFRSAIVESGGQAIFSQEAAQNIARIVAKTIEENGGAAKDLLTLPPERILALQDEIEKRIDRRSPYRAVVGGDFLPEAPLTAIGKGSAKNVRLLIGTNRDEMAVFTRPEAAGTPLAQSEMANLDLASAEPIYRRYAAAYPTLPPLALRIRFLTAEEYWVPNMRIAQAHRQASAAEGTTWVYRFDREASSSMFAGQVPHACELPYVWNNIDDPLYAQVFGPKGAVDRKIADEMHRRWVKFISGEVPDTPGAPPWPTFGHQDQILIFGDATKPGKLDEAELALWTE